jgi:two-component system, chemotaxis family, chemotaxis protein CheY
MENSSTQSSVTVMVVDDEFFFREMLRDVLASGGFKVVAEASNGVEAVELYRRLRPQITIMDIFMPEQNGIDSIKEIIAFDKEAKILIYTGLGFDDDVEVALKAGAREVILKTFFPEEVTAVINKVLAG